MRAIHDIPAPAKLNLFLHVTGRRADGYHLLQSAFVLVDCCDTLHLERRDDGRLQRHDLGAALPADDLILRAARALQSASGTALGADLHVHKRIPSGAGLGGGSSDAASTLLALNRLWGLGWPRDRLQQLGLALGADVPFFLGGTHAWVEGVGERLTPMALPDLRFEILKPPCSLDTGRVFAHPAVNREGDAATLSDFLKTAVEVAGTATSTGHSHSHGHGYSLGDVRLFGRNDLEAAACLLCPDVRVAIDALVQQHGNGRLTGSGSAVFAIVAGAAPSQAVDQNTGARDAAAVSAAPVPGLQAGWWGWRCASLAVHPLADWAEDGRAAGSG